MTHQILMYYCLRSAVTDIKVDYEKVETFSQNDHDGLEGADMVVRLEQTVVRLEGTNCRCGM
jgi:hypothetical protein